MQAAAFPMAAPRAYIAMTSVRGSVLRALCSVSTPDQAQVGATEYVTAIVCPAGTTYVPAVVPAETPLTRTLVRVPPVIVTNTDHALVLVTGAFEAGKPGVLVLPVFSKYVVNCIAPSRWPNKRASATCLTAVASRVAIGALILSREATSPLRS